MLPVALGLALAGAACRRPATEVVVRIDTDMSQGPGQTLTAVRVRIASPARDRVFFRNRFELGVPPERYALPSEIAIVPRAPGSARRVRIDVTAFRNANPLFTRAAIVTYEEQRTTLLTIFLADHCRTLFRGCPRGFTCGRTGCEPIEIRGPLPDYPGPDAGPGPDADAAAPPACPEGRDDCDGRADNGCETDLANDPRHCGACGARCAAVRNGAPVCAQGRCEAQCATDYADCDGSLATGCEAPLHRAESCGACGTRCAAEPFCSAVDHACVISCPPGEAICDRTCSDLRTDPLNCGSCDTVCPAPPQTQPTCVAGACATECLPGWADCDGRPENGCETATDHDVGACGACGTPCPGGPNAAPACDAGRCGLACRPGFGDCNADASDGCETDLRTDNFNCGACRQMCALPRCCLDGRCDSTCG